MTQTIEQLQARVAELEAELRLSRFSNAVTYGVSHPEIYKTEFDYCKEQLAAAQEEITRRVTVDEMNAEIDSASKAVAKHYEDQLATAEQRVAEGWISVKDRIPPETHTAFNCGYSDRVLAVNKINRVLISQALYPRNGTKPYMSYEAIYWMPLPKAPANTASS